MIEIEESKIKTAEAKPEKVEQEIDSSVPAFRVNKGGSIFDE
jgi:hypothetical protein